MKTRLAKPPYWLTSNLYVICSSCCVYVIRSSSCVHVVCSSSCVYVISSSICVHVICSSSSSMCLCRMMEMSSHTLAVEVVTYQVTREQLNNPVIRLSPGWIGNYYTNIHTHSYPLSKQWYSDKLPISPSHMHPTIVQWALGSNAVNPPEVQTNDFTGFLDPENVGRHWNHIPICLSFKVIGKSMSNMAAILKFRMAATRGRFRVGS